MNIAVDRRPNWSCEVCGLRVSSKKSLKSHVKRLHPTMIIDNWGKIVNPEEKEAFGFKDPSDLKKNPVVEETSNEEVQSFKKLGLSFCCVPCTKGVSDDCGLCKHCLDKPKFGGPNKMKQKCLERICESKQKKRKYAQDTSRNIKTKV